MTGVVVVGVDGSEGSGRALRWAAAEARVRGARLRAVRTWSFVDQPDGRFEASYGEGVVRKELQEAVDGLGPALAGVDTELMVVCDLPARGLLDAARDADLLVVGSRGLGGFEGLLLGSVSQQVAQHARCPVVIIPGDERGPGEPLG